MDLAFSLHAAVACRYNKYVTAGNQNKGAENNKNKKSDVFVETYEEIFSEVQALHEVGLQ